MKYLSPLALAAFVLPGAFVLFSIALPLPDPFSQSSFFSTALADDEEEDEDEDEEEDDEDDEEGRETAQSPKTQTIKVVKEVIEYQPVTETVIVTETAYATDSDGDALVDAIDPDPLVPQSEYFTDIDGDGVPNALDRYHDEDDFAYYEFETDDNHNGLLDSYETL